MKKIVYTITKNGKTKHLPKVIENLDGWADYHLISVDKNSSDGTYPYVRQHDAVDKVLVHEGKWPEQEPDIRRKAYKYAKLDKPDADILLALDDDEIIPDKEAADELFQFMLENDIDLGNAGTYHLWKDNKFRNDYMWSPPRSPHQIAENLNTGKKGRWANRGPHSGRLPTVDFKEEATQTGCFAVLHFGWLLPEEQQKQKMKQKVEEDPTNMEDLPISQQIHYKSFSREPELEPIPEEWEKHL